ncbi:AbrB/MazE/SpoVT family DNA-binding domain-containing protein [Candidatus Woesearchaeota archaeon]|nr:AbrB/MazE/SpoVT family DNA-binding domain-containing protein [Candidatus Woesearchaeota archaeon]
MKISQVDKRGQIVIPKDLREKLKIKDGTGFFIYDISADSIVLKKIADAPPSIEKTKDKVRQAERRFRS